MLLYFGSVMVGIFESSLGHKPEVWYYWYSASQCCWTAKR